MKILIDMNLSAAWGPALASAGHQVVHWSDIGDPRAPDAELMNWARLHDHVVFTNDLDLGTILALTRAGRPSVIQVRTQALMPGDIGPVVASVLETHAALLEAGALVTIDASASRVRILPLER